MVQIHTHLSIFNGQNFHSMKMSEMCFINLNYEPMKTRLCYISYRKSIELLQEAIGILLATTSLKQFDD